ncbi:MAG: hypothetical protein ACUVTU_05005 [Desulfurispora sp.]|uniref:hypothetical protein n=1 Tax=Desulfurispora sp. TaxID=3014275 RepID=UPI00404A94A5
MWLNLILLSAAYTALIFYQITLLPRPLPRREALISALLLLPALIYSYGLVLDVSLPNPSSALENIFMPLARKLGLG